MQQVKAGRILREMRGPRSATWVAAAVGISVASLYLFEAGRVPSVRNQYRIAAYFGKTPGEIWESEKEEPNHEQEHQA